MKKIISLTTVLLICMMCFVGCTKNYNTSDDSKSCDSLNMPNDQLENIRGKYTDKSSQTVIKFYMGTHLFKFEFGEGIKEIWELIYYDEEYYKIKNKGTNLYLTAPVATPSGVNIFQSAWMESSSSRQLWKFTQLSNGAYKIQAMSHEGTNLCLSVTDSPIDSYANGVNIQQKTYTNDFDYKDEWELHLEDSYPYLSFNACIYYDSTCMDIKTVDELRKAYEDAAADLLANFNIGFNLCFLASASELELDSSCSTGTLYDICDSSCGAGILCGLNHHKSASRLLKEKESENYYVYRIVGYALCSYDISEAHYEVIGMGNVNGKNAITSALTSPNLSRSIQHELTHNLGATHDNCEGGDCVLAGVMGKWCDSCANAIMNNY